MTLQQKLHIVAGLLEKLRDEDKLFTEEAAAGIVPGDVRVVLQPPHLVINRRGPSAAVDYDVVLSPYEFVFNPVLGKELLGSEITGDQMTGRVPAWQYHQHKMLDILQKHDEDGLFLYLETFL